MTECIENPAMRVHVADPALAHGRRGPITHGPRESVALAPVAAAPSHKTTHTADLPELPGLSPAKPDWKPESKPGPRTAPQPDPDDIPASPPASFAVPLDDVDG